MTAERYLVDTNAFIDSARGLGSAPLWLERAVNLRSELLASAIALTEYASGVEPGQPDRGIAFLLTLPILTVSPSIAIRAGALRYVHARRGRALALGDALIAATAIEHGLCLVTSNVRHFAAIDGLAIIRPVIDPPD